MKTAAPILLVLALAACGKAAELKPAPGAALPPTPYGAATPPTTDELLTPDQSARPDRRDELLRKSETRKNDEFNLPPE